MMRWRRRALAALLAGAALAAAWFGAFATRPVALPRVPFDLVVRPGAGMASVARQLAEAGAIAEPYTLRLLASLLDRPGAIHAGTYRLEQPITPLQLLDKLARGDILLAELRFLEGSTLRQWLALLAQDGRVRQSLPADGEDAVRKLLGLEEESAEGWLFPDTYHFAQGTQDVEILRRAHATMKRRLEAAWAARDPDLALARPYEVLILASIVEKETSVAAERPLVASVFLNRLRRGMRLQADPTVIYGMGAGFDGNIRKRDLTADTPWNTYTRDGLPPTPIAMPGAAALQAVAHPADSDFLYFVGKGDGTHQFSRSLVEHNRAVARYQLKR